MSGFASEDSLNIGKMFEIHYSLLDLFEHSDKSTLNINLPQENDYGIIEYKRTLKSYAKKLSKLKTQIYWRMSEGLLYNSQNICYYIIGIEDNGKISHPITDEEIKETLLIVNNLTAGTDINFTYKKVQYKKHFILVIKFWKLDILASVDTRIILLGPSDSGKTQFFVGLHNLKLNFDKKENSIFKLSNFDIHTDETKNNKTLILHHQYFNIKYLKPVHTINLHDETSLDKNLVFSETDGYNIHLIDTAGNSIITNIKYLISYNVDVIIYFDSEPNFYDKIIDTIDLQYSNVIRISKTSYLKDWSIKKILHLSMEKSIANTNAKKKILSNIENVILVNENRFIRHHHKTSFNKYIAYCYNLMTTNVFDKVSGVNIRNVQYKYNYKSSIQTNNSISIETDCHVFKPILGQTEELDSIVLNLDDLENNIVTTYHIIILNQIYILNCSSIPDKIIFDKIILIPEKYESIPVFIIWNKNNTYYLKIITIYKNLLS
jgi:hypothetical protein